MNINRGRYMQISAANINQVVFQWSNLIFIARSERKTPSIAQSIYSFNLNISAELFRSFSLKILDTFSTVLVEVKPRKLCCGYCGKAGDLATKHRQLSSLKLRLYSCRGGK